MPAYIELLDQVYIGPQPSEEDLRALATEGIRTVVNFRTHGEENQPLSPASEGRFVEELGMAYLHVAVAPPLLTHELVDSFREQFRELPRPVFAHCKVGLRAGLLLVMHQAAEQGIAAEEALQAAEERGFACPHPGMRQLIHDYVAAQQRA